jgi:hypothetical protein
MSKIYSPRIVQDGLVMCLDPSQNKSYPITDLSVKNGLLLWLDASDDSTFSYSSGTEVSQWRDKSGNNFHANQSTTAQQPSRNVTVNSRKGVNFTSANGDFMRVSNGIVTPYVTVFVVIRPVSQNNEYAIIVDQDHGLGYNGWVIQRNASTSFWQTWVSAGGDSTWINANQIAYTDNTSQIVTLRKNESTLNLFSNGSSNGAISIANTTITHTSNGLSLGRWEAYDGRFYNGTMCEILVFNRGLSDIELKQVNTYLGQKWGISNTDRSIIDLSGNDDNGLLGAGTITYMPSYDYYNKGSLRFDGLDDYVDLGTNNLLTTLTNNITVEAWIKIPVSTNRYTIYGNGYSGTGMMFGTSVNTPGGLEVYYPTIYVAYSTAGVLQADTWQHVVYTRNGSGLNTHAFYINGVSQTVTQTANGSDSWGTSGTNRYLGLRSGVMFNGQMSSVKVYNRSLHASEVVQNYEAQKSRFANTIVQQGLVLNLDAGNPYSYAGSGTTWYDVSGAVNDFTVVNSPTYSVDQFTLNGTTQYFSISAASGFFISSTNNFYADVGYAWSISVWFKFPVSPTSVRDVTVNGGNCSYCMFGNSGGIGGAETLSLFVSGISGTSAGFHPYFCIIGVRGSKTQLSDSSVNTNTWNNVVVTWNGSAGRGYFNGVDKGALNIGANGMQVSGYTIGSTGGGASGHLFEGNISQTFVYSRAISAAEVLQNYNAIKGRFGL